MWLIVFLVVLCISYIYLKVSDTYDHWKKKGIQYLKPWIFFGNLASVVFRQQSAIDSFQSMYATYPDARYVGVYQFLTPALIIRDPDLIKRITVKDFESFPNHGVYTSNESDPIATKNLFNLTIENGWRDMRSTLSPSFTGSKMRAMFLLMDKTANQFINHFKNKRDLINVDIKDAFRKYTNDVVAATAFGIDSNSVENPSNEFYKMSRDLTNYDGFRSVKVYGTYICPLLMKLLKISVFNRKACEFFKNIIKEAVRIRRERKIIRPDMIHLLMEASKHDLENDDQNNNVKSKHVDSKRDLLIMPGKSKRVNITIDDITAQTLAFFFAGFETSSTLMSFVSYELALNSSIQRRLRQEVDETLKNCDGKLKYEDLAGMRYLDKVVSETLRKWPPESCIDRRCKIPFVIEAEKPGEKLLYLESGTVCFIPIYPIHRDPKYYPNPDMFDPERFSDANKKNIKPHTFIPFGCGPRICIGSRFAILETKLIILRIIQKFEIVPINNTPKEITLSKTNYALTPKESVWLGLQPREVFSREE